MENAGSNSNEQEQEQGMRRHVESAHSVNNVNNESVNGRFNHNQNDGSVTSRRPDDVRVLPLPQAVVPPHLLRLQQAVEAVYIPRERYEELAAELVAAQARIEELQARIEELNQQLAAYAGSTSRHTNAAD